jgi:hypothetical protein
MYLLRYINLSGCKVGQIYLQMGYGVTNEFAHIEWVD